MADDDKKPPQDTGSEGDEGSDVEKKDGAEPYSGAIRLPGSSDSKEPAKPIGISLPGATPSPGEKKDKPDEQTASPATPAPTPTPTSSEKATPPPLPSSSPSDGADQSGGTSNSTRSSANTASGTAKGAGSTAAPKTRAQTERELEMRKKGLVHRVTKQSRKDDRERGLFRLTLIGFPAAGKTQFLNTLKVELKHKPWYGGPLSGVLGNDVVQSIYRFFGRDGRYLFDPGKASGAGVTSGIWAHRFFWSPRAKRLVSDEVDDASRDAEEVERAAQKARAATRSFVIYDASGETLSTALGTDGEEAIPGELYEVVADSDALIVLLPSNYLLPPQNDPEMVAAEIQSSLMGARPTQVDETAKADPANDPMAMLSEMRNESAAETNDQRLQEYEAALASICGITVKDGTAAKFEPSDEQKEEALEAIEQLKGQFELLSTFRDKLDEIIQVAGQLRAGGLTYSEFMAIDEQEKSDLLNKSAGKGQLAYFAMSKSDMVINEVAPKIPLSDEVRRAITKAETKRDTSDKNNWLSEGEVRQLLDKHPDAVFAAANQGELSHIEDIFASTKVDFLTTYKPDVPQLLFDVGDDPDSQYDEDLVTGSRDQAHGVDAVIEWIQYARSRHTRAGNWFMRGIRGFFRLFAPLERSIARLGRVAALLLAPALLLGFVFLGDWIGDWVSGSAQAAAASKTQVTEIETDPRYPAEVAYLKRQHPYFTTGRPSNNVRTWHEIPLDSGYFGTARGSDEQGRRRRQTYEDVNATAKRWGPDSTVPIGEINRVVASLNAIQETEEESANERAGDPAIRRTFSFYHLGLAEFYRGLARQRSREPVDGAFGDAALQFGGVIDLLEDDVSTSERGNRRILGMRIAAFHAKGLSELLDEQTSASTAKGTLSEAVNLVPPPGIDRGRVTRQGELFFIENSDSDRSPAHYSTLDLYADLVAAHIADFDAERDLFDEGPTATLFDTIERHRDEIPANHRLNVNLAVLGALLGKPLSDLPSSVNQMREDEQRAISRARDSASRNGIWATLAQMRGAFGEGDADEIADLIADVNLQNNQGQVEIDVVRGMAREVMDDAREDLRGQGRSDKLAPYVGKVPGFGQDELERDIAGGEFWLTVKWIIPAFLGLLLGCILFVVAIFAARTAYVQTAPLHRKDRLKKESAPQTSSTADDETSGSTAPETSPDWVKD